MTIKNIMTRSGNPAPNQFIVRSRGLKAFISYDSVIAVVEEDGATTLGEDWNYSRTTGKYRNLFLGENTEETRKKIKKGVYTIDNNLEDKIQCILVKTNSNEDL